MPAAQPRPDSAIPAASEAPFSGAPDARGAMPVAAAQARLADELAVPAPSPVHQLQAELIQRTAPDETVAEPLYPGWLRVAFPVGSSLVLWAAIVWGVSRLW